MKTFNRNGALITTAEGNIKSYDTGWIACSDWTNQHLGTVLGGNVVHNLNTPLRNLNVKVFISTDGTDDNSFEMIDTRIVYDQAAPSSKVYEYGVTIHSVDDNNVKIQTGTHGAAWIDDDGVTQGLDTQSYHYRIVVYKMNTVYSGVSLDYYETSWVSNNVWTNQHLGTVVGGNVIHNLNAPLRDLLVKVFISSDGTDNNSWELLDTTHDYSNGAVDNKYGIQINQVDNDNLIIQTGLHGFKQIGVGGTHGNITTQAWYYKIKVYKMTAVPNVGCSEDFEGIIKMYKGTGIDTPDTRTEAIGYRVGDTVPKRPGWYVCNGQSSTPDLRNKFIRSENASGNTGGADTVALEEAELASHSHSNGTLAVNGNHSHTIHITSTSGARLYYLQTNASAGSNRGGLQGASGTWIGTNSAGNNVDVDGITSTAGSGTAHENKPAYYSLIFIIKMS